MRAILAGILVASIYTLAIGILLSMTMPTRGQIEAYIDEARPVAASVPRRTRAARGLSPA